MLPFTPRESATDFQPLPLRQIVRMVTARYAGRPVAIDMQLPTDSETASGTQLVYQVRLLTPDRNLLDIRLDARDGRFLQVSGRGQLQARSAASKR
jgi:uncharacterized membrane protein YkoI